MNNKVLEGVRVVDLTTAYSAPFATMQLADFGAEVIKVENAATGDPARTWNPIYKGWSVQFFNMNRNKKSITLNLKTDEGKQILFDLVKTADVVVENFRPGVMKRLGIDYEVLRAIKPDIIMASLSGYGQTGPYAQRGAYSNLAEALSGVMSVTGYPDGKPTGSGVAFGDSIGGLFTALGIMYALFHRQRTGEGQYLEVSMSDAMLHMIMQGIVQYTMTGVEPGRIGCRDLSAYPYDIFEAKDGYCILGNTTVNKWDPFAEAIGHPELIDDPRFDTNEHRVANADELFVYINDWTKQRTRAEIEKIIADEFRQAYSPVLRVSEVIENEQFLARDMIVDMEGPDVGKYKMQGIPIKMMATPGEVRTSAPVCGQDNNDILKELGRTEEEIAALKEHGVI